MITQWNDEEDGALQGLPWLSQLVYLRCLRRHMDYRTGIVGLARRVSYQAMRETLYVERIPGRNALDREITVEALRTAIRQLDKAGLVVSRSTERQLVFFLPLASVDESVQNSRNRGATEPQQTRRNRAESSNDAACGESRNRAATEPNPVSRNNPPESDNREKEKEPTNVGSKKKAATRLEIDRVPEEWVLWCSGRLLWSSAHAERTWEVFRDYWIAAPGAKGRKEDWFATWRNWCRREDETKRRGPNEEHPRIDNSAPGKVERAYAERRAARASQSGDVCSGGGGSVIDLDARDYRRSY